VGGFASDRLAIGRCMGGPGGPQMLRGRKLKKWANDPEWAQNGGSKIAPPKLGPSGVTYPWTQNGGCKKHPPSGPLWGQLPIVGFWAPEGEWGWEIGKCGSPPTYFEWGNGKAHRMNFWEGLSPKEGCTACIPRPGRYATGSNAGLLSGYIGELV